MAPAPDRHTLTIWRHRIVAALTQRLLLKTTAVLLAIVLWLVVSAKEPMYQLVTVKFEPQLDSTLVLKDPRPEIRAVVGGTPGELVKLLSTPPVINRPIAADAPDTLVLDLQPSDVELPPGVDAFVQDVQPRSVTLRFEETSVRRVPVRSAVLAVGAGSPNGVELRFDPSTVEVSGPRLAVLRVNSVSTIRTTVPRTDSLPHLIDLDTARLGVRVKPTQVKVLVVPLAPGKAH
jgi:hypothetical protein